MAVAGQMNIRMDTTLKAEGDAVLAAAGFSPSQAVRALWELALSYKDKPEELVAVLEPSKVSTEEAALKAERERKLALVHGWDKKMDAFYKQLGITPDPDAFVNKLTVKQMRDYFWYQDHKNEYGLTDEQIEKMVTDESC